MICKLRINKDCKTKNENIKSNNNLANLLTSSRDKDKDKQIEYYNKFISISDLRKTDIDILMVLLDSKDENTTSVFSFNGLKIRLNLHQEILSRSLRRLKELELIEKTKSGYKSTIDGKIIFSKLVNTNQTDQRKNTQILQIYIPFKILNKQLVENLVGKWFGNLRWIGTVQSITGYQLRWKDIESFIEISVHISDTNIIVETNDNNPSNMSKAFSYSTKIIDLISNIVMRNNLLIYSINDMKFNRMQN
jgi:DNA-binding HxlR family transcriptional regulator